MAAHVDRFVLARDTRGRVTKGWRVTRYRSMGVCTVQHLRSGRSITGVIDDFGNIQCVAGQQVYEYAIQYEHLVEFYRT